MATIHEYYSKPVLHNPRSERELLDSIETKVVECLHNKSALDVCFQVRLPRASSDAHVRLVINPEHSIGISQGSLTKRGLLITDVPDWKPIIAKIQDIAKKHQDGPFLLLSQYESPKEEIIRYRKFFSNTPPAQPGLENQIRTHADFEQALEHTCLLFEKVRPADELPYELFDSAQNALESFKQENINAERLPHTNRLVKKYMDMLSSQIGKVLPQNDPTSRVLKKINALHDMYLKEKLG